MGNKVGIAAVGNESGHVSTAAIATVSQLVEKASSLNFPLLFRFLGTICLLIGGSMAFSLPFAFPSVADRTHLPPATEFESAAASGLLASMAICFFVGAFFRFLGRGHRGGGELYQKEAMAIVGLSWVSATVLGALPYYLSGTMIAEGSPITFIEAMFESQSGFSTTGATVLTDLETPELVPHCILFWRSWTHFLGGLGIVVLFVAILGQGSAGKAMMRAEMPGPTKDGSMPRMQHTALVFAAIYVGLNMLLTFIYMFEGMSSFDALCHAFGTMATGGFSTYNRSLGGFDSPLIEYTTVLFMILAGTNFTLLYLMLLDIPRRPLTAARRLFQDVEFRTYALVIAVVTLGVVIFGLRAEDEGFGTLAKGVQNGLFQVVSVITTTGYGTADFDEWNNFGRGILLLLMFVGGCAGSTGGGMKVIRHVLFYKILRLEIERAHRPRVVRPLRVSGVAVDDPQLAHNILLYFCMVLAIFVMSWLALITFEPNSTWGVVMTDTPPEEVIEESAKAGKSGEDIVVVDHSQAGKKLLHGTLDEKLLDSASAVAATLNNIGPGLGVVGATRNYAGFSQGAKLLFVWLMMLGRVEIFSVLLLFVPSFWRRV
ncbi:TrkH family potassium uptake protein [Rhodopirellula baltica]|uniref:TRK potassium uptake system protein (TrkH) n=1 Tax=Rhodopirellula baltica WH47 TaxID=991778 RepID=F2APV2_RHOBT|nr:TrkH family potassium uptake protein [Rhodopirellula baltica]EGF28369.1 TRK potassium uptake system protein (trkH) [Rhodopirellula baltica WH47]